MSNRHSFRACLEWGTQAPAIWFFLQHDGRLAGLFDSNAVNAGAGQGGEFEFRLSHGLGLEPDQQDQDGDQRGQH